MIESTTKDGVAMLAGGSQAGDRRAGGYVAVFLPELRRAFTRLATFERPVVAAVNGHAIAGVTELLVGVPFPAVSASSIVGKIVNTGPGPVARKAGNRERT